MWQWGVNTSVVEGALAIDDLTLSLTMAFVVGGVAAVLLSWRSQAAEEAGEGEFYALLLSSILGMVVLVAARTSWRCSWASSCSRSRSTSCARRTCGASTRSSLASST